MMPSNHFILCHPLLFLPSIFPSIRVFCSESVLHIRWPKYWNFSFSISPSNEYSGLISFRMDWFDLLAAQGTLESLLQHHSSKASILRHSAFFIVQHSHLYMATGKTIALTRQTFVSKVMSLLFNMLSRLVITFLPRSKHLLITWLQSPSAVIFGVQENKVCTVFIVSHLFAMKWWDWIPLVAQMVKNLPALQETQVRCLGQEDSLEKGMATHSSILAWRIPWTKEPSSPWVTRVGHDWATNTLTFSELHKRTQTDAFCIYSGPSVSSGDWFQSHLPDTKIADAQVLYIKWCSICRQPMHILQ